MLSNNKISKGGLIGALVGLLASLFCYNKNDAPGKKVIKSSAFGLAGYFLGIVVENKINQKRK